MKQLGTIDGKRFEDWPAWKGVGVPTRDNCDIDNPRQTFLWMYTALPGMQGAPLLMPTEYWEMVSWRQCVLGGGLVAEPGLKYQPPLNMANPWTAAGAWVPLGTPDPPRKSLGALVGELGHADRAELKSIVLQQMGLDSDADVPVPDGKYRISDLAKRLDQKPDDVVALLAKFGMTNVRPNSLVGRDVADRIVNHLGL